MSGETTIITGVKGNKLQNSDLDIRRLNHFKYAILFRLETEREGTEGKKSDHGNERSNHIETGRSTLTENNLLISLHW